MAIFSSLLQVCTKLGRRYSNYGVLNNACQVFDKMPKQSPLPWNALLREYARNGSYEEALQLYSQMQRLGIRPDNFTFAFVLKACSGLSALAEGRKVNSQIVGSGFQSDVCVGTALIDMYAKCSRIEDARHVFDEMPQRDVVSWNAMIAGYAQNGLANETLTLFCRMRCEDVMPNSVTMVNVLPVFGELGDLKKGKCLHAYILRNGFDLDLFVSSSLIDMYAKCGSVEFSRQVFHQMSQRDEVSWNAMVAGYAQNGCPREALTLFHQMLEHGIRPNSAGFASATSACSQLGALQQGKWIHDYMSKIKFELDVFVTTSLMGMYAKCGRLEVARDLFDKMPERDVVSWNVMIVGYVQHGRAKDALELFSQMQDMGMKPNDMTFSHILAACRCAGLVKEACCYFDSMTRHDHIEPNMKQYLYMVELLSHAGYLNEALSCIKKMPVKPDSCVWRALLYGYKIHKDIVSRECVG